MGVGAAVPGMKFGGGGCTASYEGWGWGPGMKVGGGDNSAWRTCTSCSTRYEGGAAVPGMKVWVAVTGMKFEGAAVPGMKAGVGAAVPGKKVGWGLQCQVCGSRGGGCSARYGGGGCSASYEG